jgi:hypothetical protein
LKIPWSQLPAAGLVLLDATGAGDISAAACVAPEDDPDDPVTSLEVDRAAVIESVRSTAHSMNSVAIIIPAYNASRTLAATIDSTIGQAKVSDIIVVDDGSLDNTLSVARQFEPRVRVLTGPNRGASAARNRGISATTARWLLFLDADDILEPSTVAQRLLVAKRSNADIVICDWREMIDDGGENVSLGGKRVVDWAFLLEDPEVATAVSVWATTAAILYRRDLVERIGGFRADLPIIQDARFLFDATRNGARFAHAQHVGARYRILPTSLSRRDPARFWLDVLRNGEQIEVLWRSKGPLGPNQKRALSQIYDNAARGLFDVSHPGYFAATKRHRSVDHRPSLHSRIAAPLAHLVGLKNARTLLAAVGPVASRVRHMRGQ